MIAQAPKTTERYRQLRRMLAVVQTLSRMRFGSNVDDLQRQVADVTGERWSRRTVLRDCLFLESTGAIDRIDGNRFKWNGCGIALLETAAK